MNVRPIKASDVESLIRLRAHTRENAISREGLRALGVTEQTVTEMLHTTHRGWLCEVEGQVAGFSIGDGSSGELWVIAVLPAFEGRGIGSRLLATVEEWLWSIGWDDLWLWTSTDESLRAFSFYISHGWRKSETKDDLLYMRRKKPDRMPQPSSVFDVGH